MCNYCGYYPGYQYSGYQYQYSPYQYSSYQHSPYEYYGMNYGYSPYGYAFPYYGLPLGYAYTSPSPLMTYGAAYPRGEHRVGNCLMICQ